MEGRAGCVDGFPSHTGNDQAAPLGICATYCVPSICVRCTRYLPMPVAVGHKVCGTGVLGSTLQMQIAPKSGPPWPHARSQGLTREPPDALRRPYAVIEPHRQMGRVLARAGHQDLSSCLSGSLGCRSPHGGCLGIKLSGALREKPEEEPGKLHRARAAAGSVQGCWCHGHVYSLTVWGCPPLALSRSNPQREGTGVMSQR